MSESQAVASRAWRRLRDDAAEYLDRATAGARLVALHETSALRGHWSELGMRLAVARRARGAGELLRDQIDLLAESRERLRRDHEVRQGLWRGWLKDFTAPVNAG